MNYFEVFVVREELAIFHFAYLTLKLKRNDLMTGLRKLLAELLAVKSYHKNNTRTIN